MIIRYALHFFSAITSYDSLCSLCSNGHHLLRVCSNKIVKQGQFENFASSSSNLSFPTFSSTLNARVYILNGFLALENCSSHVLLLLHKSPKTWLILETSFFDTEKIWMTKENRFINSFAKTIQKCNNFFFIFGAKIQMFYWLHIVWKILKMSHLIFSNFGIFYQFFPIKTDLSGNTVWPQAVGFQKLAKINHYYHF